MPSRPLDLAAAREAVKGLADPHLREQLEHVLDLLTPLAAALAVPPHELEFPEQVLRPLDDELALSLATPSAEEEYSFFDNDRLFED